MKAYASDLSDAQWAILEPLIPPAKPGDRPRSVNMRQILNGIFYVLRSGGAWRSPMKSNSRSPWFIILLPPANGTRSNIDSFLSFPSTGEPNPSRLWRWFLS